MHSIFSNSLLNIKLIKQIKIILIVYIFFTDYWYIRFILRYALNSFYDEPTCGALEPIPQHFRVDKGLFLAPPL